MKYTGDAPDHFDATFNWDIPVFNLPLTLISGKPKTRKLNWLLNDEDDREVAAELLLNHIMEDRKKRGVDEYYDRGMKYGYEPVTIIGHSHGGNVAIQAIRMLHKQHGIKANLITIETPAYNDHGKEDPRMILGLMNHLAIYNDYDGVQGGLAGEDRYENEKTLNLRLWGIPYKPIEMIKSHSYDNQKPEQFLKSIKVSLDFYYKNYYWLENKTKYWLDKYKSNE